MLDKSNAQNLKLIKEMKDIVENEKRNQKIVRMGKWDRFRTKRKEVIDAYIA